MPRPARAGQRIQVVVDLQSHPPGGGFAAPRMQARLALRFKLQQGSPVRAMVLLDDGIWRVGSTMINAAGGGCTVPEPAAPMAPGERTWPGAGPGDPGLLGKGHMAACRCA